jgi:peptide/nickel transport system substrate-binding protein
MNEETREKLMRVRSMLVLDKLCERVKILSPGDRILLYLFASLIGAASFFSLYSLEQLLLVDVPAYGGTLVEGEIGSPRFINPLLAISDADRDLSALAYAGLMGISGDGELVPVLAASYEMSADGKTYTFTIRDDAIFSDGSYVTADDVIYTVQKAQNPALKSPRYADWSGVRVVAVDQHTVRFTLNKAYAPFIGITTLGILPARIWKNVSDEEFPFSSLQTSPIGAGPFKVSSISRGVSGLIEKVSLARNSDFVLGAPYLDGIRFYFYPRAEDLASAIRNNLVESAYDVGTRDALTVPYARVFGVFWNPSEKHVYARDELRKALSLAINRQYIIDTVLGGYATAIMGPVPPGGSVIQVPVPQFENPVAEAADILTSNGWIYNGTERTWENRTAKQSLDGITLRTSNVPELKSVASALKADWEKLGIPVNVELYEPGDLSQNVIRPRKYEALLYGTVIGRDKDLYAFWDSQERNDPGLNIALYANKTVDALLESTRGTADEDARKANLQKIEDLVAADYPAAFIYSPNFTYVVPEGLSGVELPQIIVPADRFATVASWYRYTDKVWPFFANRSR